MCLLKALLIVCISACARAGCVDFKLPKYSAFTVKYLLYCVFSYFHPAARLHTVSIFSTWYDVLVGLRAPPSHLPMSLVEKSPSREPLKWNIWFHFDVPRHLNHLAGKDAGRVVKLLCLAAGSTSADSEHKAEERYHQARRHRKLMSGNVATAAFYCLCQAAFPPPFVRTSASRIKREKIRQ